MAKVFSVDASAMRGIVSRMGDAKRIASAPFADGRGLQAAKIMREGKKGVRRQFVDQTEYLGESSIPWAKTKKFGTRKAQRKTMLGTGRYRAAWLGAAGAIERITDRSVALGVDAGLHPQVQIHQGRASSTRIHPTPKMRWYLGFTYGVWLSAKTMKSGFLIARRRVSVSSMVQSAVARMLKREVAGKVSRTKLSTGASE